MAAAAAFFQESVLVPVSSKPIHHVDRKRKTLAAIRRAKKMGHRCFPSAADQRRITPPSGKRDHTATSTPTGKATRAQSAIRNIKTIQQQALGRPELQGAGASSAVSDLPVESHAGAPVPGLLPARWTMSPPLLDHLLSRALRPEVLLPVAAHFLLHLSAFGCRARPAGSRRSHATIRLRNCAGGR